MIAFVLVLLLQAAPVDPLADPLAVASHAEGWLVATSTLAPPAARRELVGARWQGVLGVGRWGIGIRAESVGLPGLYKQDRPETYQSVAAYAALHRNVLAVSGYQCGPAGFVGAGVPLDQAAPKLPHALTGGIGARCSGPGTWAYVAAGSHQALRGVAGLAAVHVRMSDRLAWVGDFAVGARGVYVAAFGVAVRAW